MSINLAFLLRFNKVTLHDKNIARYKRNLIMFNNLSKARTKALILKRRRIIILKLKGVSPMSLILSSESIGRAYYS